MVKRLVNARFMSRKSLQNFDLLFFELKKYSGMVKLTRNVLASCMNWLDMVKGLANDRLCSINHRRLLNNCVELEMLLQNFDLRVFGLKIIVAW